jgi:hypothetical protein
MGKRLSMCGVVGAVGLVGCGGGTTASTNALRPKVTTTTQKEGRATPSYPALASGAPCPRTPGGHATQTPIITLGHGPVYPIMGFPVTPPGAGGVVDYQGEGNGGRHRGGFWGTKVLIAVSPSYTGAFTVQGKQIDGPSPLDWLIENSQQVPKLSLPEGTGWRYYPTEALLQGAGCYALRIEGTSFSRLVVFKAVDDRTFRRLTKQPANPDPAAFPQKLILRGSPRSKSVNDGPK